MDEAEEVKFVAGVGKVGVPGRLIGPYTTPPVNEILRRTAFRARCSFNLWRCQRKGMLRHSDKRATDAHEATGRVENIRHSLAIRS